MKDFQTQSPNTGQTQNFLKDYSEAERQAFYNLDPVAQSCVLRMIAIVPVGAGEHKKGPFISKWGDNASYLPSQLLKWSKDFKLPKSGVWTKAYPRGWGMPCLINKVAVIDVDLCDKYTNPKPTNFGPLSQDLIESSPFGQTTQSGGEQRFFLLDKNFKSLTNATIPGTSIDIRTSGGQAVLYGPLNFEKKDLFPCPPELFKQIQTCFKKGKVTVKEWEKNNRNNTLNREAFKIFMREGSDADIANLREKALESGLEDREILATINSAEKAAKKKLAANPKLAEKNKKKADLEAFEASLAVATEYTKIKETKPVHFMTDFLLDHDFNFVYGAEKLGKSRVILNLIQDNMTDGDKCGVLSIENDKNFILKPLFEELKSSHLFSEIKVENSTDFPDLNTKAEKTERFLDRIRRVILKHKYRVVLLDPLPRFLDWNKEDQATPMVNGLRKIAKDLKCMILGIRNEGKSQEHKTQYKFKGSSAITDISRQSNRAVIAHPRSALGKEMLDFEIKAKKEKGKKWERKHEKRMVIYTERSSCFPDRAFLYRLEIRKRGESEVAIPVFCREIENASPEKVNYLCDPKSGRSLKNKMFHFIRGFPGGGCTLDDLRDEFGDSYEDQVIKNAAYTFDWIKHGGVTLFILKVDKKWEK